jgi:small nuclear ribonucleoprotein (snRNP)-like protein
MEWKDWEGKRIFVQLKSGGVYSGKVIDVDESANPIVFITITDKYGEKVTFVQSEIIKIVEEREEDEHLS